MNKTTYLNLLRMVKPFMKGSIMKVKLTATLQYLVTGRTDRLSTEITTLTVLPQDPALWGQTSMVFFQSTRAKICFKLLSYMLILISRVWTKRSNWMSKRGLCSFRFRHQLPYSIFSLVRYHATHSSILTLFLDFVNFLV